MFIFLKIKAHDFLLFLMVHIIIKNDLSHQEPFFFQTNPLPLLVKIMSFATNHYAIACN